VTWRRGVGIWAAVCVLAAGITRAQQEPAVNRDADFPPLKVIALDVVDPVTNKPVAGVKIAGRVSNQQRTWETGEDGHVKLDVDGGARSLTLSATKDGFVPTTVTWASPRPGEGIPGEFLLKLERGTTIGGTVTDQAGKPIAGADVVLSIQRKGDRSPGRFAAEGILGGGVGEATGGGGGTERAALYDVGARTGPDGRWRFDQAPARVESLRVRLVHPDFLSDEAYGVRTPPPEEKLRDQSSVMVMTPGVTLAGRVVDPQGRPVEGAMVSLGVTQFRVKLPSGTSGADGRFALAHCRPGQRANLIVKAGGWAPALAQVQSDKDVTDLEVKLEAARPMRIRVVDSKGQPVTGAVVSSGAWRGVNDLGWRATTGADGRVVWNEAPSDGVAIGAAARGYVSATERAVVAGEQEHVITLTSMTRIAGTVVDDATGKPVETFRAAVTMPARPGVMMLTLPEDLAGVTYGGAGTFELMQNRRRAGYVVRVEAPGSLPQVSRDLKAGEEDVKLEFRLKKGRDLVATLRRSDGAPLDGADVLLVNSSSQVGVRNGKVAPGTLATVVKSDPAGRFRMDPQAGEFSLIVVHERGYGQIAAAQLAGDEPVITVQPWATVRGTAWVGAKPAAGRTILAMDVAGRAPGRPRVECVAVADEQGRFVLDRVPPGPMSVAIEVRDEEARGASRVTRVTWTQQREVKAEAGRTVEVKLGGVGRAVVGRLIAPPEIGDKAEWRYAQVRLTSRLASKRQLPPDWATLTPEARLKRDEEWFRSPEGQAELKLERERRRSYPARVSAADGTFRVDDVEAGDYYLSAQLARPTPAGGPALATQTWAAARSEITIGEGKVDEVVDVGKVELSTSGGGPNPIRRLPTRAPAE
jgi:hypothetical protein